VICRANFIVYVGGAADVGIPIMFFLSVIAVILVCWSHLSFDPASSRGSHGMEHIAPALVVTIPHATGRARVAVATPVCGAL
jgi:hypothetical protein